MSELLLYNAILSENVDEIKSCINRGVNVNGVHTEYGCMPIHFAVLKNNIEIIELLLTANANINIRKETTGNYYVTDDKNILLKMFDEFNNDVAANNIGLIDFKDMKHTALDFAALVQDEEMVEFLIFNGAKLQKAKHALKYALKLKDYEIAKILIDAGGNVNSLITDGYGFSTLLYYAIENHFEYSFIEYLLSNGANPNLKSHENETPLHAITCTDEMSKKILKLLLKNNANVDALNSHRQPPLMKVLWKSARSDEELLRKKIYLRYLLQFCTLSTMTDLDEQGETYNIFYICTDFEILRIIFEHLAVRHIQNCSLDIEPDELTVPLYLSNETHIEFENGKKHYHNCIAELTKAKETFLKNSFKNFLNLLVDKKKVLIKCAGNEDLVNDYKNSNCAVKFPIYGVYMRNNMRSAIFKRELYDTSSVLLSNALPMLSPDHLIIRGILDYFGKKDLIEFTQEEMIIT